MRFRIEPTMNSSKDQGKGKAVDKASFLKTDCKFIAELLAFNIVDFFNIVIQGTSMNSSDQKIILSQFKDSI